MFAANTVFRAGGRTVLQAAQKTVSARATSNGVLRQGITTPDFESLMNETAVNKQEEHVADALQEGRS